jgi:hypothetical protein
VTSAPQNEQQRTVPQRESSQNRAAVLELNQCKGEAQKVVLKDEEVILSKWQ